MALYNATEEEAVISTAICGRRIENAMISARCKPHPQVVSTNRHVLQGWVEMKDVRGDRETRTADSKQKRGKDNGQALLNPKTVGTSMGNSRI